MVSFHHGCPFGATASVVAWHRVGALIEKIARKILHVPLLRYVDDFFAAERCACCCAWRVSYVELVSRQAGNHEEKHGQSRTPRAHATR